MRSIRDFDVILPKKRFTWKNLSEFDYHFLPLIILRQGQKRVRNHNKKVFTFERSKNIRKLAQVREILNKWTFCVSFSNTLVDDTYHPPPIFPYLNQFLMSVKPERDSRNNGDEEEVARKALANVYGDEGKIEQSIAFSFSFDESSLNEARENKSSEKFSPTSKSSIHSLCPSSLLAFFFTS